MPAPPVCDGAGRRAGAVQRLFVQHLGGFFGHIFQHRDIGHEQPGVHHQVQRERNRDGRRRHGRGHIGGANQPVDDIGLAPDLGHVPAGDRRDPAGERHPRQQPQQPARQAPGTPAGTPAEPHADPGGGEHQHPHADHDPKGEKDRRDRRMAVLELVQALDLAVDAVGEDEACQARDRNLVSIRPRRLVGPGKQQQRRAARGLPDAFHRGDLLGLVLERIEAVQVAEEDLQRRCDGRKHEADAQHARRRLRGAALEDLPRAQPGQQEGAGQRRCGEHVREAVRKRRVEDDREPARRVVFAGYHLEPGRCLHPRVERQDPERRQRGAEGDAKGCEKVDPLADLAVPEQHHAQKPGFEEEGGQHLVAEQRPGDIADLFHIARPVGAELEAHGDAADHAERESQREDLGPEPVGIEPGRGVGREPAPAEKKQQPAQRDADGREEDVERDIGRELDPGQCKCVHRASLAGSRVSSTRPRLPAAAPARSISQPARRVSTPAPRPRPARCGARCCCSSPPSSAAAERSAAPRY